MITETHMPFLYNLKESKNNCEIKGSLLCTESVEEIAYRIFINLTRTYVTMFVRRIFNFEIKLNH